jgi:hypothetical protein
MINLRPAKSSPALWMKRNMLLLLLLIAVFAATAQTPMFSYVTTATANTVPLSNATSSRCQFLYKPGDFPWAVPGMLNRIYIRSNNAVTAASWTNLTIKLGVTTKATLVTGAFETGLTTVYTAPATAITTPVAAGGWFMITLQTPFAWNLTDNLLVDISQTAFTGNFSVANSSTAAARRYGSVSGTTGTGGAGLANLGFDLVTTPCSGTPVAGTILASSLTPCLGTTATLRLNPYVLGSGIDFQWEEWSGTAWINAAGGTGATTQVYTTPAVMAGKRYRARLTCNNGTPAIAYTPEVTIAPPVFAPVYTEDFESITANNQLPNCMTGTNMSAATRTYITNQTFGTNHTTGGSKFGIFHYTPAGTNAFFTPDFTFQAGKTYLFSFWYRGTDNTNTYSSFGAYYGRANSVAAMVNPIGTATPTGNTYREFRQYFTPTVTGTYYIGIVGTHTATLTNRYISIDDLGLRELPACTGKPAAGVVSPVSPCVNQSFTLTTTGGTSPFTVGNLTYQWQDSSNAGWLNSVGASTNATLITTVAAATKYRLIVTCTATGLADTSAAYLVNPAPFIGCYCTPVYATGAAVNSITNVRLKDLNNTSTAIAPWYSDFAPSQPATVRIPTLTMGVADTVFIKHSTNATNYSGVWIDFNHSGSFETSEFYTLGTNAGANGEARIPIQVPVGAKVGITRMRIRGGDRAVIRPAMACNATGSAFGEAEDYLVNVRYPLCSGPANAGTAHVTDTTTCRGYTVDVSDTTHEKQLSLISWLWEQSTDGGLSWTDVPNSANKDTLNKVPVSNNTSFRLKMICDNTGDVSYSNPVQVRINKPYECYCYSQSDGGKTDSSDIGAVVIGTMVNSSGGPHISNPDAIRRRTSYTKIPNIVLSANGRYRLSVYHTMPVANHSDARVSVFIDYNNNLTYDVAATPNSELVYSGITTAGRFYLDTMITIPNTVVPNVPTGLRVILNNDLDRSAPANQGCGAYTSGETEDYVVMFTRTPQSVPRAGNIESLSLFPNPANGQFVMKLTGQQQLDELQVRIYNITGQEMIQRAFTAIGSSFTETFDMRAMPAGVYFVAVSTSAGDRIVRRIILN